MTLDERIDLAQQNISARIRAAVDGDYLVRFACYGEDSEGIPVDNLDEIAFHGQVILEDEIEEVRSDKVLTNPTWLEVCVEANNIIQRSGNAHHVWIEGLYRMNGEDEAPAIMALNFGS